MDIGILNYIEKLPVKRQAVTDIFRINQTAFVLSFERKNNFLPGQVVALSTGHEIPPRLYSICSGTNEKNISILFTIKEDGLLTPKLSQLTKGDPVLVSAPFGAFLGDNKPSWWIASGTGIAPYRSMIRSGIGKKNMLIHGGRTADSFYFHEEMIVFFAEKYIRCCSQGTTEGIYEGRLTQWLREQETLPANTMFYLCGSAEMVVEVRDILIEKGIAIDKIMSEIYF